MLGRQPPRHLALELIGQRVNSITVVPRKSENCVTFSSGGTWDTVDDFLFLGQRVRLGGKYPSRTRERAQTPVLPVTGVKTLSAL